MMFRRRLYNMQSIISTTNDALTDQSDDSVQDEGFAEEAMLMETAASTAVANVPEVSANSDDVSSGASTTSMQSTTSKQDPAISEQQLASTSVAQPIPISDADKRRDRCVSGASFSTSCTSGLGTCSSVEDRDVSDFDMTHAELSTHKEEEETASGGLGGSGVKPCDCLSEDYSSNDDGNDEAETERVGCVTKKARRSPPTNNKKRLGSRISSSLLQSDNDESSSCDASNDAGVDALCDGVYTGRESSSTDSGEENTKTAGKSGCDVTAAEDVDREAVRACQKRMREVLHEYVRELPVPMALQHFLLFYRE